MVQRSCVRRYRGHRHPPGRALAQAPAHQMDLRVDVQRPDAARPPDENDRSVLDEGPAAGHERKLTFARSLSRKLGFSDAAVHPLISHTFLEDLAMVLCVAAVTTIVFQ